MTTLAPEVARTANITGSGSPDLFVAPEEVLDTPEHVLLVAEVASKSNAVADREDKRGI